MALTRRPLTRAELRFDVISALGLAGLSAVIGVLSRFSGAPVYGDTPAWVFPLTSLAIALPLALRRVAPWPVAIVGPALYIVFGQLGMIDVTVTQVIMFLAIYSVGAWDPDRRRANLVRGIVVAAMFAWLTWAYGAALIEEPATSAVISGMVLGYTVNIAYFGGAWVFGNRSYDRAIEQDALEAAEREIDAQRAQLAEQAVAGERLRIARELHDVVAHHVSAMGIQAGAARRTMRADAERAEAALRSIESSAREAVAELRTMVVALRSDGESDAPMPTLADIDGLLATARESGQRVDYRVVGEPVPLAATAELTLVRILQESLTNARKHAGHAAQVDARLRYEGADVELEVSDDGHGAPTRALGTGMGLTGMRERVAAVGGTVSAGARPDGGWIVRARVPTHPMLAVDGVGQPGSRVSTPNAGAAASPTGDAIVIDSTATGGNVAAPAAQAPAPSQLGAPQPSAS